MEADWKGFLFQLLSGMLLAFTFMSFAGADDFARVSPRTAISKRCYCGDTFLSGEYRGRKSGRLSIVALDWKNGQQFSRTQVGPGAFQVGHGATFCYRLFLVATDGRIGNVEVTKEPKK